jgi:hypothetical protein
VVVAKHNSKRRIDPLIEVVAWGRDGETRRSTAGSMLGLPPPIYGLDRCEERQLQRMEEAPAMTAEDEQEARTV